MNEKGRQVKLLAAVAILAMVVCAFAIAVPSEEVQGEGQTYTATPSDLQSVINNATDGDVVELVSSSGTYGTLGNEKTYTISKSITIRAAEGATPVIFGGLIITANGVTVDGLTINPDGENNTAKNGINAYADTLTVKNCTITAPTNVNANGIAIFPQDNNDGSGYVIADNRITGFATTNGSGYSSAAVCIGNNIERNYFGNVMTTSATADVDYYFAAALMNDNTISNCSKILESYVWSGNDITDGVSVIGDVTGNDAIESSIDGIAVDIYVPSGVTASFPASFTIAGNFYNEGTVTGTATVESGASFYNFGTASGMTGSDVKTSRIATTQAEFSNYLSQPTVDVVMVETGTFSLTSSTTVTKEILVKGDAVITGTVALGTNGSISVDSTSAQGFTVTGGSGATAGSAVLSNVVGEFTVTYGSVVIDGEIVEGSVTVSGNATISGTIAAGVTVTIAEGAKVTVAASTGLVNNGTLNIYGYLNAVGTLENNGTINMLGTSADLRSPGTLTLGDDAVVNGVSYTNAVADNYNGHIYSTIANAMAENEIYPNITVFIINGTYSADDVITQAGKTVQVAAGASYSGKITYNVLDASNIIYTTSVTGSISEPMDVTTIAVTAASSLTVSALDVTAVSGGNSTVTQNSVTTNYKTILSGVTIMSMTLTAEVDLDGKNTIPADQTLTFGNGGKLVLTAGADRDETILEVYGSISRTTGVDTTGVIDNHNALTIVYYTAQNYRDVYAVVSTDVDASDYDHLVLMGIMYVDGSNVTLDDANYSGSVIVLTNHLIITDSVTLNNVTIYTNGWNIYIGDGTTAGTLILNNSTIDRDYLPENMDNNNVNPDPDDRESITVRSGSSMDVTDSLMFIEVEADDGSSVEVDNADVTYDSSTSEVRVGYGTTLYFSSTAVSSINVYGELIINSTASIPSTNVFNVWSGASLVVNGTITSLGDVHFYEGSDVTIANGGSFVLGDRNGGADMTVEGDLTVEEGATFTVTAMSNTAVARNTLNVESTGNYAFTVLGTMTIGGYYTGAIHDQGAITFNGTATGNATIYIYDGVTLTVTSVSGSLTVSDYGIVDLEGIDETSDASYGNEVVLENVRGVTVSETVTSYPYIDENDKNRIDYVANMYVSGTATTGGEGKITIDETGGDHSHDLVGEDGDLCASVIVSETLTLGKDVAIEVAGGELLVSGTITATTADSEDFLIPKFTVSGGELTVTGTVTIAEQGIEEEDGQINAVTYTVTGETETYTYTNFPAAVAAASGVDNYTITVMGNVSVAEDVTVPTGIIIEILNGDELTIAEDVTVIITAGATVNASGATIDVDGTMTSQDYEQDLNVGTIEADVVTTDGASRTWTSLANALANSSAGQTITANGPIIIEADTTIPEGVTVYTEYTFTVDGATLTINGTLQMDDRAVSGDNDGLVVTNDADSEVIANGVLSIEYLQSAQNVYIGADLDGAHFTIRNGAYRTSYVSNVEFAAETASNNTNLEGNTVTIIGIVSAGDVTFASPDNLSLIVNIEQKAAAEGLTIEDRTTILTAGTITLEGNTALQIRDNNTRVTATVSALSDDGSETASIGLRNVYGTLYFSAEAVETATGNEYEVSLNGVPSGAITISSGTVALNADLIISNGSTLTVESGAELVVADGTSLYGGITERVTEPIVIDGTMTVQDEDALSGYIVVNGTLAADGVDISVGDSLTLRVTGDLTIEDGHELSIGDGYLFVGEKPQALGATTTGSVTGTVNFAAGSTGIILAYNGADLTGADIQLNAATGESEAASTAYYINEILYATVYTVYDYYIGDIYDWDGGFDLNGIEPIGTWYETAAEAAAQSEAYENVGLSGVEEGVEGDYIGDYSAVYGAYANVGIPGQISVGTGMTLYIDGLMLNNYLVTGSVYALSVGTHTVTLVANANYTIENATITFNGQTVQNGGTITIDSDMLSFSIIASGASPTDNTVVIDGGNGSSDMGLTDYLLIVLVILIVIMAIIVALRLMRS